MDLLIKNAMFNKPKSCFTHAGRSCHLLGGGYGHYFCVVTFTTAKCNRLNKDCPIVELPEHGDLIERDRLKGTIGHLDVEFASQDMCKVRRAIDEAPAVLEASE